MKIKLLSFILLFIIGSTIFPALKGNLPEVLNPKMISVIGDELLVTEDDAVYIYSLKDLSLKVKFGRKGAGPGEFQVWNFQSIWIKPFPDYIIVVTFDKIMYFSREGKLIKEIKKHYLTTQITPVGKNFVGKGSKTDAKNKIQYVTINLYDSELKKIKELFNQKFLQQGNDLNCIMDFLNFKVYDDKIFIEESPNGFVIEVFDEHGNKQYEINRKDEKTPVTNRDKEAAIERLKEEPTIKQAGWEAAKQILNINFPDYFPPISNLEVVDEKIYIKTFKTTNGEDEFLVLDLKGNLLKKALLPHMDRSPFWHCILDLKLYTIANDTFYYLKENLEEEWELHTKEIKSKKVKK